MGALSRPLRVTGAGAVTPAGLTAPQACAAFRAALSAFEEYVRPEPFGAVQLVARIPAHWRLRRSEGEWLVNMAARAIVEAQGGADPRDTLLLLIPPESFRGHPAYEDIPPSRFLAAVIAATGLSFHRASRALDGGPAAAIGVLDHAQGIMAREGAAEILLGGVDSLINKADLERLDRANRLKGDRNAQGLVPGEAAVFVRLSPTPAPGTPTAVLATGVAQEADTVASERYSQGRALLQALRAAVDGPGPSEPEIDFVVSNGNGERYSGWEAMIARPRFYRTRREILPTAYPAMTFGEIGTAGAAMALMVAADSFAEGYAPGRAAMCEVASEGGLRAAAVVAGGDGWSGQPGAGVA
jgi:3-oxoacyl-[acyl-carrier-protein] synthase-1